MTTRGLLGTLVLMVAVAPLAAAEDEGVTDHVSVEFDAGLLTDYDGSGMWGQGYDAGVTGLWSSNGSTLFCARFGLSNWPYVPGSIPESLVPAGSVLVAEQSSGQIQKVSLTPILRYQREEALSKLGAFLEGGVGIAYMRTHALTEVVYRNNAVNSQDGTFEIEESVVRAEVFLGAGLSHFLTSSSWIDLMSTYQALITSDTAHIFSVHVGFRVRV